MLHVLKKIRQNNEGATAVEMALVLPLFLLLVLGIMESARAYWILNSMQLAIDEAGRYAMVHTSTGDSQLVTIAKTNLYGLNPTKFTVTSSSTTSDGINYKVISASYPFSGLVSSIVPIGNFTLTRQTTVPILP